MPTSDGWTDEEDAKFCSLLLATWNLERTVSLSERSSEAQIWSQISDKLRKANFTRGTHACKGHWFDVVCRLPGFQNTFPFDGKPLPNHLRNKNTAIVSSGEPRHGAMRGTSEKAGINTLEPNPHPNTKNSPSNNTRNLSVSPYEAAKRLSDEKSKKYETIANDGETNHAHNESTSNLQATRPAPGKPVVNPNPSNPGTNRNTHRPWSEEEWQKLEELTNAAIKADFGKTLGARLKGRKFFEVVSKQLKESGFDRGVKVCSQRWQRFYPNGSEFECGITSDEDEDESEVAEPQNTTKPKDALEASEMTMRWGEEEKASLADSVASSLLDRKGENGNLVMPSIQWTLVQSKHQANGYARTSPSLRAQWRKRKDTSRSSMLPAPVESNSEDDLPLSLRTNKFKNVKNAVINKPSFVKSKESSSVPARKQGLSYDLRSDPKKRNHAAMLITESDEEAAEREQERTKRVANLKLSRPARNSLPTPSPRQPSATSTMQSQIKDLEAQISALEKNATAAPSVIIEYEAELADIETKLERLRERKEKIQGAKMKKWELMTSGTEKLKLLRAYKSKLEDAISVMKKMGL